MIYNFDMNLVNKIQLKSSGNANSKENDGDKDIVNTYSQFSMIWESVNSKYKYGIS